MSTRASAPRCASCGMPLGPEATACGVCGARVPLIARPADESGPEPAAAAGVPTVGAGTPEDDALGAPPPEDPATRARAAVTRAARRAAPGGPHATGTAPPIGSRLLAHAVDLLLVALAVGLAQLVHTTTGARLTVVVAVLTAATTVGLVLAEGLRGATPGAVLLGLRTVDDRTGEVPGVGRALVRQALVAVGVLACGVGNWLVAGSGAWDASPWRRGWHDRASGTLVVRAQARTAAPAGGGRRAAPAVADAPTDPAAPAGAGSDALQPPRAAEVPGPVPAVVGTAPVPVAAPGPDLAPAAAPPATPAPPWAVPARTGAPADAWPGEGTAAPAAPGADGAPGTGAADASLVRAAPGVAPSAAGAGRSAADLLPPPPTDSPAVPAPPPALVAPHTADLELVELEHTRVRDPEQLRRRSGTLALSFDTGERVRVVGRGLVGRGPRAEDGTDILHVVTLHDAARSVSRVHLEFGPEPAAEDEPGAVWVVDRGSTNGTVVVDPTGAARVLPAGTRAVVRPGWTVRIGSREARVEDD